MPFFPFSFRRLRADIARAAAAADAFAAIRHA